MKRLFTIFLALGLTTMALNAQLPSSGCCIDIPNKKALIKTARKVAKAFGPEYVIYFNGVEVSNAQVFQKDDYGDSLPEIRKQIGREYYTVRFAYDSSSVRFSFNYAAKVRIWKDTGEPLDVIFGNGMGRNFFSLSFKMQTKRSAKKKHTPLKKVPLQTEKGTENIWN